MNSNYNRRSIVLDAWEIVRRFLRKGDKRSVRQLLSHALKSAWYSARQALYVARQVETRRQATAKLEAQSVESLQSEITTLENKTLLGHDGMERVSQLRHALSVAQAREATIQKLAA